MITINKVIGDNLYLILIERTQVLVVLNKFILVLELVRIKKVEQSPTNRERGVLYKQEKAKQIK